MAGLRCNNISLKKGISFTFMKNFLILFVISFLLLSCNKPTLLDTYKAEISSLKTEEEIEAYWNKLLVLDQNALENNKYSIKQYDSVSITHMMRTALMFEIHGSNTYKLNNTVPEMHFTHNYFGLSNLAFWPIIKECVNVRGNRKILQYPAYQLEGIAGSFYDYSVYGQPEKHLQLLEKLNKTESDIVSQDLYKTLIYQIKLKKLKLVELVGKWQRQPFKEIKIDGFFEFVKMSDNLLYHIKNERPQKLELVEKTKNYKIYRIEKEPFGWSYKLNNNGELSLIDDNDEVLISYSKLK